MVRCVFMATTEPLVSPRNGWAVFRAACGRQQVLPLLEQGVRRGETQLVEPATLPSRFEIMRWIVRDEVETMTIDLLVKLG